MKIPLYTVIPLILLLFSGCNGNKLKDPELQNWDKIELLQFKKENATIASNLHFYNPNPYSIMITMVDLDVLVNGKDVGSYISKGNMEVKAESTIHIPIKFPFNPQEAIKDMTIGLLKIKSDHVVDVRMKGSLTINTMDQEKVVEYDLTQKVLFSNNKKLGLDSDGKIIEL